MKTLLVMRHAKSGPAQHGMEDHARPLNERGRQDAPQMGRFLAQQGLRPGVVISSTAKRARKTAELVAKALEFTGTIEATETLYLAEPSKYIQRLALLDDTIDTALLIGHNPAIEGLITKLSGEPVVMPTAAVARIDLDISDWAGVGKTKTGSLKAVWRPKEI